jgi:hypothetical protein
LQLGHLCYADFGERQGVHRDFRDTGTEQGKDRGLMSLHIAIDVLRRILDRQYDGPNAVSHEISEAQ